MRRHRTEDDVPKPDREETIYASSFRAGPLILGDFKRFTDFDWDGKTSLDDFPNECILLSPVASKLSLSPLRINFDVSPDLRRILFEAYHRTRYNGFWILHKCVEETGIHSMSLCVNPRHLALGTAWDNSVDSQNDRRFLNQHGHTIPQIPVPIVNVLDISYADGYSTTAESKENDVNPIHTKRTLRGDIPKNISNEEYVKEYEPFVMKKPCSKVHPLSNAMLLRARELIGMTNWENQQRCATEIGNIIKSSMLFDYTCNGCSFNGKNYNSWSCMDEGNRRALENFYDYEMSKCDDPANKLPYVWLWLVEHFSYPSYWMHQFFCRYLDPEKVKILFHFDTSNPDEQEDTFQRYLDRRMQKNRIQKQ